MPQDELTPEQRAAEIERLERVRDTSKAMGGGYKERVAAIEQRLEELRQ